MHEPKPAKRFEAEVLSRLKARYRDSMKSSLEYSNPWEMLVATMLSAQSTDRQVNKVTKELFRRYSKPNQFARLSPQALQRHINSLGLYRNKSKNIIASAKMVMRLHGGKVPNKMNELVKLPGVGRKTANVVLSEAFSASEGIAIDTHCITVANRLGLVNSKDPEKIERKLMEKFPSREWRNVSNLLIALGRDACTARIKHCERCVLNDICPSSSLKKVVKR